MHGIAAERDERRRKRRLGRLGRRRQPGARGSRRRGRGGGRLWQRAIFCGQLRAFAPVLSPQIDERMILVDDHDLLLRRELFQRLGERVQLFAARRFPIPHHAPVIHRARGNEHGLRGDRADFRDDFLQPLDVGVLRPVHVVHAQLHAHDRRFPRRHIVVETREHMVGAVAADAGIAEVQMQLRKARAVIRLNVIRVQPLRRDAVAGHHPHIVVLERERRLLRSAQRTGRGEKDGGENGRRGTVGKVHGNDECPMPHGEGSPNDAPLTSASAHSPPADS